jgi:hypothetical protein
LAHASSFSLLKGTEKEYMGSSDLEMPVLENDVNSSVEIFLTMYVLQYHVAILFKKRSFASFIQWGDE